MNKTKASKNEPQTPITIPMICASVNPVMLESVDSVISAADAVKPASANEVLSSVASLTKVVKSEADTVLACSMVSSVVATTVLVDRFRRRVKTV